MKIVGSDKLADVSTEFSLGYVKEDSCGECTCHEKNVGPDYLKPTDMGVKNPGDVTTKSIDLSYLK